MNITQLSTRRWKHALATLLTCVLLVSLTIPVPALASESTQVYVDGQKVQFTDAQPLIKNGRTLVPVRPIVEAMGAQTTWNSQKQRAEISLDHRRVNASLQSSYIQKYQSANGSTYSHVLQIDEPAQLVQNRTMVPLRAIGESLGYKVSWNSKTKTVSYTKGINASTFKQYGVVGDINELSQNELDVFWKVNNERAFQNVSPLSLHVNLSKVAREKSKDMSDRQYFDHTSPTYGSPFDMMRQFGITFTAAGENIAAGQRSPAQVMDGWMNSDGHRKNILSTSYSFIGVGHFQGNTGYYNYWTQMFIK